MGSLQFLSLTVYISLFWVNKISRANCYFRLSTCYFLFDLYILSFTELYSENTEVLQTWYSECIQAISCRKKCLGKKLKQTIRIEKYWKTLPPAGPLCTYLAICVL